MQLHWAKHGLVTVLASFRCAIGDEVFQRGKCGVRFREVAATDATHHRGTQLTREHRVLAIRLFHSRPTGIAREVEHGAIADVATLQAYLLTDDVAYTLYEFWRPRGSQSETCRKHRGANRHVAMRGLLSQEQGNAQPRVLLHILLKGIARHRCQFGSESVLERFLCPRIGTERSPEHPDIALGNVLFERLGRNNHAPLPLLARCCSRSFHDVVVVPCHRAA